MLYLQNSYGKRQSASADVGDTRHVSLAGEEKCDLQIVALERQGSFSSSSTDYEEIDLSEKSYPESGDNESDLDLVNSGSDDDFQSDSPKDDPEMENREDSDGGLSEDDNVRNDTILTEEFAAENDNFSDQKDVDDHDILTDEDEFENISNDDEDEEEMNRDSEDNLENNSEQLEDEMADSDNEISISNDISITIANESLIVNSGVNLEIVDDEVDNNSELNQVDGGVSESINKNSLLSLQRIIVSRSDSEEEKDNHIESKTKTVDRNHSNGSQVPQEKGSKRDNPVVESVTVITSPANIKTKVAPVNKGKLKQAISKSETSTNVTVTSLQEGKKSTSKPLTGEKQGIVTSSNFQNSKDLPPKEKSKDKDKEKEKPHVELQTAEVGTMTDFPFYSERAVDVGNVNENEAFSDVDLKDSAESPNPSPTQTETRPEGVDLLNTGTLLRKKDMIMREAKRRRTARSKKGQRRNVAGKYDSEPEHERERARAERKSFFHKLCCCVKQQSAEYEVDPYEDNSKVRYRK